MLPWKMLKLTTDNPLAESIMAGYSGTPLVKKLGIQPGMRIRVFQEPDDYAELISPIPERVTISNRIRMEIDIWHLFVDQRKQLEARVQQAMKEIKRNGMIWVSWPKKSSGRFSEVTEDTVREVVLPLGLVDVKVCAIDETWSALKVVIRKELR